MTLQTIKSPDGKVEYVLLPVAVYQALKEEIREELESLGAKAEADEYVPFVLEDYVDNPLALARIKAGLTQEELARRLGVSQAYISKIEGRHKVTAKVLEKVRLAIRGTAATSRRTATPRKPARR